MNGKPRSNGSRIGVPVKGGYNLSISGYERILMANVRPFRGLRYTNQIGGGLTDVICPPYDVISLPEQRALASRSPFNAIQLELPEGRSEGRYRTAATLLTKWQQDGILRRDNTPCYYITRHRFLHETQTFERWGLTAAVMIEDYDQKVILPHEYTRSQAKEDRYQLMAACDTNLSPVMSLYHDPSSHIRQTMRQATTESPSFVASYGQDDELTVWVDDSSRLDTAIQETLRDAPLFIADGHHRYETALRHRDATRERAKGWSEQDAFNYVMMTLIDFDDPGLLVLPYHRALQNVDPQILTSVWSQLLDIFDLTNVSSPSMTPYRLEEIVRTQPGLSLGLINQSDREVYLLTLKSHPKPHKPLAIDDALGSSEGWILHSAVLEPIFGSSTSENIVYEHDPQEAWDGVFGGQLQMAFFLKPFPMELFRSVVSIGQRLPPKSTFFHPKLATGLVFNPLSGKL